MPPTTQTLPARKGRERARVIFGPLKDLPKTHYLIIGNGAAGISAVDALRSVDQETPLTVISEEPCPAYSKVLLHHYIGGEVDEEGLFIRSKRFYQDLQIEPLFGIRVDQILPDEHKVYFADGSKMGFDKLLIATGSSPWKPSIQGIDQRGVYTMWTLKDARQIRSSVKKNQEAIVIGGSFVGMQVLHSLRTCGLKITVVDIADHLMPRSLDPESARVVQEYLEEKGVRFLLGVRPIEITPFKKKKKRVMLEDGRSVSGDIIIVTTGAKLNIDFTEGSSIKKNTGLLVDESMRTNYPDIFAAGDVAEVMDCLSGTRKTFGLWTAAVEQGRIAGLNMAGKHVVYSGGMDLNTIEILGLPIITIGMTTPSPSPLPLKERDCGRGVEMEIGSGKLKQEIFVYTPKRVYRKFFFEKDRLIGAILIGHVEDAGVIGNLIRSKRSIDPGDCHFGLGPLRPRHIYLPYAGGYGFRSI